jgi:hypothetical protein
MEMSLPSGRDEAVLVAALRGDQRAWTMFEALFRPSVRTLARRWCPDLPSDLQEEVAHEVWTALAIRQASRIDAGYGPAIQRSDRFHRVVHS